MKEVRAEAVIAAWPETVMAALEDVPQPPEHDVSLWHGPSVRFGTLLHGDLSSVIEPVADGLVRLVCVERFSGPLLPFAGRGYFARARGELERLAAAVRRRAEAMEADDRAMAA